MTTDAPSLEAPRPGAPLLRLVAIMDQLRSPGGCPWDAEQTHQSLAPYLLEETHELLDAIDSGSVRDLREELGDVLLQVVFHARLAEELPPEERFDLDDVAVDVGAKLKRRHPHVFAAPAEGGPTGTASDVEANWDVIKRAEKQRTSVTDGVPTGLPALALATKLASRARRGGVEAALPEGTSYGARLFALALEAAQAGVDPELALRATALEYAQALRRAEDI